MKPVERSDVELQRVLYSKLVREVQTAITRYDQRRNPTQSYGVETDYTKSLAQEERSIGWLLLSLGAQVLKRANLSQVQPIPTKVINLNEKPRRLKELGAHLVMMLSVYYLPLAAGDDIEEFTLPSEKLVGLERDLGPQLVGAGMLFLACADDREAVTLDLAEPDTDATPNSLLSGSKR